jgi:hypothetical protein
LLGLKSSEDNGTLSVSVPSQSSSHDNTSQSGHLVTPIMMEDQSHIPISRTQSKRQGRHPPRALAAQIAQAYKNFIYTSMIVDEFWSLSNEKQAELCKRRNVVRELMEEQLRNLTSAALDLSLPRHTSTRLKTPKTILEDQIYEYLVTHPLYSETLYEALRDTEIIQVQLDLFRRQLNNIIQISVGKRRFEVPRGEPWKIVASDGTECFKGSFLQLYELLSQSSIDFLQNTPRPKKRKKATETSNKGKHQKKAKR